MIGTVAGLPAIVIDRFRELESQVDLDNKNQVLTSKENQIDSDNRTKSLTQKLSEERKNGKDSKSISGNKNADYSVLADKLKSLLGENNLSIEFSIDKDINKMVMKVIDNQTQEVVRQFPPDITLKIARIVSSALGTGNVTNATV